MPIYLIFNLRNESEAKSYPKYVSKWKVSLEEAYQIVSTKMKTRAQKGKKQYHKKVNSSLLIPGDRVLVGNLKPRGGPASCVPFGNKIFTSLLLGWALRVLYTKLDQNLLKVENVFYIIIFYCHVTICQLNSHLLSEGLIAREQPHINHLYSPDPTSHMLHMTPMTKTKVKMGSRLTLISWSLFRIIMRQ